MLNLSGTFSRPSGKPAGRVTVDQKPRKKETSWIFFRKASARTLSLWLTKLMPASYKSVCGPRRSAAAFAKCAYVSPLNSTNSTRLPKKKSKKSLLSQTCSHCRFDKAFELSTHSELNGLAHVSTFIFRGKLFGLSTATAPPRAPLRVESESVCGIYRLCKAIN